MPFKFPNSQLQGRERERERAMEKLHPFFHPCILLPLLVLLPMAAAQLRTDYYAEVCPNLESLVLSAVTQKVQSSNAAAPGTLRLLYHDCFVRGCDASVMIISSTGDDEWHSADDSSIQTDGFNTVIAAKAAVDNDSQCKNKVSCADILALAARDAVALSGGPNYTVELGRLDGKISTKDSVHLAQTDFDLDQLNSSFAAFNLTLTDMIALSGAHTIGVAHCNSFWSRLYNYSVNSTTDPTMNSNFASSVSQTCPRQYDSSSFVFLDSITRLKFDNAYYQDLQQNKGLLGSDQVLYTDARSRPTVNLFASNQSTFFKAFVSAITKLGRIGIHNNSTGEIRVNCKTVNNDTSSA